MRLSLAKYQDELRLEVASDRHAIQMSESTWGNYFWTFFYLAGEPSNAHFGVRLLDGYHSGSTGSPLDLSSANELIIGNWEDGRNPVNMVRRVEIYAQPLTPLSSPSLDDVLTSKPNLITKTPPV